MNAHQRRVRLRWRQRTLARACVAVGVEPPTYADLRAQDVVLRAARRLADAWARGATWDTLPGANRPVEPRRE